MPQLTIFFVVVALTLLLFIWGYWRYDVVALLSLLSLVVLQVIPPDQAFIGFSNPAVVTVACVMVITQAINDSGVLDKLLEYLLPLSQRITMQIFLLSFVAALLSAFMNNVGALALMIPVAMQSARATGRSPSLLLMPIAFGSALGGLITVIGTPPNILISSYREQILGEPYHMFDFSFVGVLLAGLGVLFIAVLGWRLIPLRRKTPRKSDDVFEIESYITEIKIPEESPVIGKTVHEFEAESDLDFQIVGMIRGKRKRLVLPPGEDFRAGDILIVEGGHSDLEELVAQGKLELVHGAQIDSDLLRSKDIRLIEAVIPQGSRLEGRSSQKARLRSRYHMNVIAISREGSPFRKRLNHVILRAGDVLLIQGDAEQLDESIATLGLLPLVERGISLGLQKKVFRPILIFAGAIVLASLQIVPVYIAFALAVLVMTLLDIVPARKLYENIDWSIIILLGAMIPIGNAMQSTGGTMLISSFITQLAGHISPIFILGLLMLITMTLSDFMNNAATAVVMAPIAASIAKALYLSPDPFLMTVAVGASCSFLTPIGHQNNTLVMGPGGYKFFDYFRLGLPLEFLIIAVGLPAIVWRWPYVVG